MACEICENKFEKNILYENDKIIVMLSPTPVALGHIQIFSKQHYQILEQVPFESLKYIASAAKKTAMFLFQMLKIQGTNIIIENGVPAGQIFSHFSIHIIPRTTEDKLKLEWEPQKTDQESLESIKQIILEGINSKKTEIFNNQPLYKEKENKESSAIHSNENESSDKKEHKSKSNFLKIFERIP